MTKLEWALDAAARGLRVFPADGKKPRIRAWPDNATCKESVIRRWWTSWPHSDIGIALDADSYVLDADTLEALLWLELTYLPRTLTVATARGRHLYFKVPYPLARLAGARSAPIPCEGKGAPGPVTWAGSVHPSGHVYRVTCDAPIADMPSWLVFAIGPKQVTANHAAATPDEQELWSARRQQACAYAPVNAPLAVLALDDARADLRLVLRTLRCELPDMPTGWSDRLYRAGAYLGPCVAAGALGLDEVIGALTDLFLELDAEKDNPEHALRSIERGVAAGARQASE